MSAEHAGAPKRGTITLARHGEPALSRRIKLTSDQYRDFWARYEIGGLAPDQSPPTRLTGFVERCDVLISSTRLRAIESARIVGAGKAFTSDEVLIEAPLPPPPWPAWIRLSPRLWGFFARFWWWFFNHHEGQETRREAEARADRAAARLDELARGGQDVVVLAHGFFNVMIARSLRRMGWRQTLREGIKYWSTRRFERA